MTALCLGWASVVLATISISDMIPVFSFPLGLYSFIFLCSMFSWSDTMVRRHLLISLPVSPIAYMTLLHTKSLKPPIFHQRPSFQALSSSRFPFHVHRCPFCPFVVFHRDRRIALSCSGYSTMACLERNQRSPQSDPMRLDFRNTPANIRLKWINLVPHVWSCPSSLPVRSSRSRAYQPVVVVFWYCLLSWLDMESYLGRVTAEM